jgi:hypothetical protein
MSQRKGAQPFHGRLIENSLGIYLHPSGGTSPAAPMNFSAQCRISGRRTPGYRPTLGSLTGWHRRHNSSHSEPPWLRSYRTTVAPGTPNRGGGCYSDVRRRWSKSTVRRRAIKAAARSTLPPPPRRLASLPARCLLRRVGLTLGRHRVARPSIPEPARCRARKAGAVAQRLCRAVRVRPADPASRDRESPHRSQITRPGHRGESARWHQSPVDRSLGSGAVVRSALIALTSLSICAGRMTMPPGFRRDTD